MQDHDLTPEEMRMMEDAERQNETASKEQYAMDEELQRTLVGTLLRDQYFVLQSGGLIRPEYFKNEVHQALSEIVFDYHERYPGQIPLRSIVMKEIEARIERKPAEVQMHWRAEVAMVYEYYIPGLESRDYLLDEITNFAKARALQQAFFRCVEVMTKRKRTDYKDWVARCHELLNQAMTVDRHFDMGLDYFQTVEERYERVAEKMQSAEIFTLGLKTIDKSLTFGGMCRGELGSVIGISGTGKSLFLANVALHNLGRGKRVLYVSLEIDEDMTAQRFDTQIVSRYGRKMPAEELIGHPALVAEALKDYIKGYEDPRTLIIKQFPAGEMSMADFRAYYAQVTMRGFKPDLVIVDYVGEMEDLPDMPTWESRYKLVRGLRNFATREKVCVLTAMQPNKSAEEVNKIGDVIDQSNLGDAYAQIKPLDCFWSINQTKDEKAVGLARFYIAKHRNGKSRFWFPVRVDPVDLTITEISVKEYEKLKKDYLSDKKDTAAAKAVDDVSVICTGGAGMDALSMNECGDDEPKKDGK